MTRCELVTIAPDGTVTKETFDVPKGSFPDFGDGCLRLFGRASQAFPLPIPEGARVLEIGCHEADFMGALSIARRDVSITGIDWLSCQRQYGRAIHGDVLTYDFPPEYFDVVVGISSIEHIGLGHYNSDPLDVDGDTHCLERAVSWLKPGGWVYFDVPWQPDRYEVNGTKHRVYHTESVASRLLVPGLTPVWQAWSDIAGETLRGEPTERHPHFWVTAIQAVKA